MGRGADWAVQDVVQLRQWLDEGQNSREMRAMRPDWSLDSIKTKLKQLRRGAPDESRPLKRRRTSEVLAEIEAAVTETPRQTLSVLRRHSSLDMSRSTLWRALHEDLQARCFKPVRAPRLTTATRLARLNFCRDVLQRVGRALGPWQTAVEAFGLDARGVLRREVLPLELPRTRAEQPDLGGWGPRTTCTKGRSRSRCVHQRAQPAQPKHNGGRRDGERHRFPAVLHRIRRARQRRVLHSDAGRRVLATLHGAPWHRHVELVVAGRQRSVTHQPTHQGVFEGARNPASHVASVLA